MWFSDVLNASLIHFNNTLVLFVPCCITCLKHVLRIRIRSRHVPWKSGSCYVHIWTTGRTKHTEAMHSPLVDSGNISVWAWCNSNEIKYSVVLLWASCIRINQVRFYVPSLSSQPSRHFFLRLRDRRGSLPIICTEWHKKCKAGKTFNKNIPKEKVQGGSKVSIQYKAYSILLMVIHNTCKEKNTVYLLLAHPVCLLFYYGCIPYL